MTPTRPSEPAVNEAAERLLSTIGDNSFAADAIRDALATERRNTVKRVKAWFARYKRGEATIWAENSDDSLEAILDEIGRGS